MASTDLSATLDVVPPASFVRDLAEQFQRFFGATTIPVETDAAKLLLVPEGQRAISIKPFLDEFRSRPERRAGTAVVQSALAFAALVNRHKDTDSAIFALRDPKAPSLTAVIDYHKSGSDREGDSARFCAHRVQYPCELSDEWKAWFARNGQLMSQADFAAFLEDRIGDVIAIDPSEPNAAQLADLLAGQYTSPSGLIALARGLQVNVETAVHEAVTLSTGEISIRYAETHRDGAGAPIRVPNLFCIAIPVFYAGAPYRITVRLRYRVQQGRVQWSYHLYRPDRVFDDAFQQVCDAAGTATELPVYLGEPEA
jgi:uncharacterized protein YfdQ (DUF2303 family)